MAELPHEVVSEASGRWSVLLVEPRPVEPVGTGAAIAAALGLPETDGRLRARGCGGLVLEGVARPCAETASATLERRGIAARIVPADRVPPAVSVRRVASVELEPGGLRLGLAGGPSVVVAWDEPALALAWTLRREGRRSARGPSELSRAALRMGERLEAPEPALRLADTLARLREREQARLALGLDLLTPEAGYRLVADRLRWIGPRPPTRVLAHTWWALVDAIAQRVAAGALPPETGALRAGLADPTVFHSREEITRYSRWWRARA